MQDSLSLKFKCACVTVHSLVMSPCSCGFLKALLLLTAVFIVFNYYLHAYTTYTGAGF